LSRRSLGEGGLKTPLEDLSIINEKDRFLMTQHLLFTTGCPARPEQNRRELFSYARLNQVDQFAQSAKSIEKNLIMQNKPNFKIAQINTTSCLTEAYGELSPLRHPQNKPNQTQFKPKTNPFFLPKTAPKAKTNPIQTQNLPAFAKAMAGKFCGCRRSDLFSYLR